MGNTSSIPRDFPLGCLLQNWGTLTVLEIKSLLLLFFCNTVWPRYKLEDGEAWPINGNLNYNTILQVDLFCRRQEKWSEVPYAQASPYLRERQRLRGLPCGSLPCKPWSST